MRGPSKSEIERLSIAIIGGWSLDTVPEVKMWCPDNPANGQCFATTLVTQDYLGGRVLYQDVWSTAYLTYRAGDFTSKLPFRLEHCSNELPDGSRLDASMMQFTSGMWRFSRPVYVDRETLLRSEKIMRAYQALRRRVVAALNEEPNKERTRQQDSTTEYYRDLDRS